MSHDVINMAKTFACDRQIWTFMRLEVVWTNEWIWNLLLVLHYMNESKQKKSLIYAEVCFDHN